MLGTTVPRPASDPAALTAAEATRASGTAAIAVSLALRTELWAPLVGYREHRRWTALLEGDDVAAAVDPSLRAELAGAQVWLLSWLPGQSTGPHDHGPSSGAFAVARGALTERVVAWGRGARPRETSTELATGRLRFFGPHHVHQVSNGGDEPAVSVHVYAPRLTIMNTYRVEETGLVRTGTERAGVDW